MRNRFPLVAAAASLALTAALLLAQVNILGYWWENPMPFQETPPGLVSIRAADCGLCHEEIYREWQISTHAHALSDRQFQAELHKSPETRWLCLNCHTPLLNQRAQYAVSARNRSAHEPVMESNARYDPALEEEAITCAVCHVRDGVILGPYGDSTAPHPVRQEPKLLGAEACTQCHQATAVYTDTLICTFDTGLEWRQSPYADRGQPCSHCHMPAVERSIAPGGPGRPSRRHYFLGSMIPKEVLGSLNGFPLNPRYLYRSGLEVQVESLEPGDDAIVVALELKNAHAGHLLPTGDPERFIRIEVSLSAGGRTLAAEALRIGQHWEWWPEARKLSDNRLKPLEQRVERVSFPGRWPRPATVDVRVFNVRIAEDAARYHNLIGPYPTAVEVQRVTKRFP